MSSASRRLGAFYDRIQPKPESMYLSRTEFDKRWQRLFNSYVTCSNIGDETNIVKALYYLPRIYNLRAH